MAKALKSSKQRASSYKITTTDLLRCAFFVLICNLVGYLSSFFQTTSLRAWYPLLVKSKLTPPNYIFPIVWSFLFVIIGISTCLSYKSASKRNKNAVLFMFILQLFFGFLWTFLFFGIRAPITSFIEIAFYVFVIWKMMMVYKKCNYISYVMLYPYLIWTIFATYLNFVIIIKNFFL